MQEGKTIPFMQEGQKEEWKDFEAGGGLTNLKLDKKKQTWPH